MITLNKNKLKAIRERIRSQPGDKEIIFSSGLKIFVEVFSQSLIRSNVKLYVNHQISWLILEQILNELNDRVDFHVRSTWSFLRFNLTTSTTIPGMVYRLKTDDPTVDNSVIRDKIVSAFENM